jgi:hypothetical protein
MDESLSFPVGRFERATSCTPEQRAAAIEDIVRLPRAMRDAVAGLDDEQLATPYRPGGWTVRQVVHHVADSHMNGFIRVKMAMTEDVPLIKPYDQDAWATLDDVSLPIEVSLSLLDALHARWGTICHSLTEAQFAREFRHPEIGVLTVDAQVQLYAWHSRHHVAHVTRLRTRRGW